MTRFRRRTCITLGIVIFIVCSLMMALKSLRPETAAFGSPFGLGLLPERQKATKLREDIRVKPNAQEEFKASAEVPASVKPISVEMEALPAPNSNLHAFYYTWYGNPQFDGKYIHWNHKLLKHWDGKVASNYPTGKHNPPEDIGANFYPELGPYSSRDTSVLENHMKQMRSASIGNALTHPNPSYYGKLQQIY